MKKIRILLADDHQLMRSGLRLLIEQQPDLTVVGEAADGREAVALAKSLRPDVAVMDISMPNLNGIEAAHQITQSHAETAVIVLSMHPDESYVLRALKAGARSEEHTSELQSRLHLVCRLLLEKKKKHQSSHRLYRRRQESADPHDDIPPRPLA